MVNQTAGLKITGHVLIKDDLGNVIVDKMNGIHSENMSLAIAESISSRPIGPIKSMVFGNGGATVSGVGTITYLSPNLTGINATLYNQTYSKIVNDLDSNNVDPTKNKLTVSHVTGNLFSDLIVNCSLEYGEPSGQNSFDTASSLSGTYVFSEIGLVNYDGKLLCMVVFSPIEKSTNRTFDITYTLRYQLI